MSEEEIKTMVNNAFKRLSKELEENPDNLINYSKLQEKYIQLLKDKVKLKQENQKYKEVIDGAIKILGNYKHYSTPDEEQNSDNEDLVNKVFNILKEVKHE